MYSVAPSHTTVGEVHRNCQIGWAALFVGARLVLFQFCFEFAD